LTNLLHCCQGEGGEGNRWIEGKQEEGRNWSWVFFGREVETMSGDGDDWFHCWGFVGSRMGLNLKALGEPKGGLPSGKRPGLKSSVKVRRKVAMRKRKYSQTSDLKGTSCEKGCTTL